MATRYKFTMRELPKQWRGRLALQVPEATFELLRAVKKATILQNAFHMYKTPAKIQRWYFPQFRYCPGRVNNKVVSDLQEGFRLTEWESSMCQKVPPDSHRPQSTSHNTKLTNQQLPLHHHRCHLRRSITPQGPHSHNQSFTTLMEMSEKLRLPVNVHRQCFIADLRRFSFYMTFSDFIWYV